MTKQKIAIHYTDQGPHTTTYYGSVDVDQPAAHGGVVYVGLPAPLAVQFIEGDVAHFYANYVSCTGQDLYDLGFRTAVDIALLQLSD